ncbi:MAG: membrane protein insertion efficiency factor YidD [Clostridia bacterium]|nr:membrane protein insertion efficiency factor YidD [Clostridia bacterium]
MLKRIVLWPVRMYRRYISPLFPPCCRFTPTCSQYCLDAVEEWGVIRGLAMTVWRIMRCNPWSKGGHDPVPENPKKRNKKIKTKETENE